MLTQVRFTGDPKAAAASFVAKEAAKALAKAGLGSMGGILEDMVNWSDPTYAIPAIFKKMGWLQPSGKAYIWAAPGIKLEKRLPAITDIGSWAKFMPSDDVKFLEWVNAAYNWSERDKGLILSVRAGLLPPADDEGNALVPGYIRAKDNSQRPVSYFRQSDGNLNTSEMWKSRPLDYGFMFNTAATHNTTGAKYSPMGWKTASGNPYTFPPPNTYTGRGSYAGTKNNLFTDSADQYASEPSFTSRGDETGALTIRHTEYIKDIYGNSVDAGSNPFPFTISSTQINPGLEESFPWLSQVAQNFEEYSLKQLVYTFKSTLADVNSANGQVGSIVTATNYNPSMPEFRDKGLMMQYAHAHTTIATMTNVHGVEADPGKLSGSEGKFVRASGVPATEDIKTYDHGKFQIAVCGTPAALADLPIGELWVDYTIELRKPKLFTGVGMGISSFQVKNNDYGHNTLVGHNPVGNLTSSVSFPVYNKQNTLNATLSAAGAGVTQIDMPDTSSGYFELRIKAVVQSNASSGAWDWFRIQQPELVGNIEAVGDMEFATGTDAKHAEPQDGSVYNPASMSDAHSEQVGLIFIGHYKIRQATGGTKNAFKWGNTVTSAFDGRAGDTVIWRHPDATTANWDGTANGSTFFAGEVEGCEMEIVEYNSPVDNAINQEWCNARTGAVVIPT